MTETHPTTRRLYYFTTKAWGLKSLWEKRLKVSRYTDLNDPFELAPFDLARPQSRDFWTQQLERIIQGDHGVLCFSEDWRSTLLWSHYADKHAGLCLGFDVSTHLARPVEYIDQPLPDPIEREQEFRKFTTDVLEAALLYKHNAWRYEREWRLRVKLNEASDGLYYKKFDDDMHLRQVIIGAQCSLSIGDVVEAVVNPPLDVDISKARASFNTFDITQHEHVSTHTAMGFRAALALARDVYHHDLPDDD